MHKHFSLSFFLKCSVMLWLMGTLTVSTHAQSAQANTPIKLPPHTVEGTLANGLHYLILPNPTPAHTTEFRLIMRVGSVQENDKQKGGAHFLEHMAFAGSKHFPGRSMIDELESYGMKFGRDINAVTGFDRTIFMFTVPMDKTDSHTAKRTLLMLHDCLAELTFEAERTKRERGVILEELRGYDFGDDFYDLKMGNGRFIKRIPLGSADDIRRIDRQTLIGFYKQWYSPRMATVVVVGNVDAKEIEKEIKKLFAPIPDKPVPGFRTYPLTYQQGITIQEVRDTLRRNSELELMIPHPCVVARDIESYYRRELGVFLFHAISRRFRLQHIRCNVSDTWYLSDKNHFALGVEGKDKAELLKQVSAVVHELHSIRTQGFDPQELSDALNSYTSRLKAQSPDQLSAKWCDDFVDYIISGDRYINTPEEMNQVVERLKATDSRTLQNLLAEWLSYEKQTLLVAYRNYAGAANAITEEDIRRAWDEGESLPLTPFIYKPQAANGRTPSLSTPSCLAHAPEFYPWYIDTERFYPDMKVTDVKLKNGVRLVLRPTTDKESAVMLHAFAPGGTDDLSPQEYQLYEGTGGYMEMGGIAKVNQDTLSAFMSQEDISMNIAIDNSWHEVLGMIPAERIQMLLNLVYEKITDPELPYKDFEAVKQDEIANFGKETLLGQMLKRAPDRMLTNRLDSLMGNASALSRMPRTVEKLQATTLDGIADYYKRLFGNPDGLTFVLTGPFDAALVKQQLAATFGRLQKPARPLQSHRRRFQLPERSYIEGFPNEKETQTIFDYILFGEYKPSLTESLTLKLLRDVMQNRLLSVLRDQESVVYSPYVSLFYHGLPQGIYYFDLSASVDYANTGKIDELLKQIVTSLRRHPIDVHELETLKKSFLVTKRQVLSEGAASEWKNTLTGLLKNGETLESFEHYARCLQRISPQDLKKAAKRYLHPDKFVLLYIGKHQNYE